MRVIIAGEECEAIPITAELALLRGCLGGQRPEILPIQDLWERVRPLPERRERTRRFARRDRRHQPRNDRRGEGYTYLEQRGRRRGDVYSIAHDRVAAEDLAAVRTRLGIA